MAAFLTFGCARPAQGSSPASEDPSGRTIAVVDGREISAQAFDDYLTSKTGSSSTASPAVDRAELFEDFVLDLLLDERAKQAGIEVSDAEVEASLKSWRPEEAQSSPQIAPQVRRLLTVQRLIHNEVGKKLEVSLPEIQEYYRLHAADFIAADRVRVLEILVEDRAKLDEIRRTLKPGDIRAFRQAAQRFSEGATAERGGDLGLFEEGVLPKEFDRVVFSLKAGEISRPVQSGRGYHLFMVEEQVPRHPQKFYEVQKEIYEKLLAEKEREALDDYLKQILQDASIDVRDEDLRAEWRKRHAQPSE